MMERKHIWKWFSIIWTVTILPFSTGSSCTIPSLWHGEYFHLGFSSPLMVNHKEITFKGKCVEKMGTSQYIMQDTEYGEKCWRCMNIFRKHQNVLQYKESYCETYFNTYEDLCMGIGGDSPMYSMFRRDPSPIKCPFKGPFSFSYSKGGSGDLCSYPQSYMDSCTDHTRLQLNFQACIDVQGSESVAEGLQCIATWKEGPKKYLVAEMKRDHVYSDESKYRCFVFDKKGKGPNQTIEMAQSVAASCKGLWSPAEGYRTFHMKKVSKSDTMKGQCMFPKWLSSHHSWSTLDGLVSLHINKGERSWKLKNEQDVLSPEESHVTCHNILHQDKDIVKIVTYVKSGCDSGFMCSVFSKKASHVVAAQFGYKARNPAEACTDLYFPAKTILFVSKTKSKEETCPLSGQYELSNLSNLSVFSTCSFPSSVTLKAGCGTTSLEVKSECEEPVRQDSVLKTQFSCHSHWREGTTTKVLLSKRDSKQTFCLSYSENTGSASGHSEKTGRVSAHSCQDEDGEFNMTETGQCLQALSSVSGAEQSKCQISMFILSVVSVIINAILKNSS